MRRPFLLALFAFFLLPVLTADEPALAGFSTQSSQAQRQWEQKFKAIPTADNIRDYDQRLSARPNNVGTFLRQGQRRMDPGEVQGVGPGRAH